MIAFSAEFLNLPHLFVCHAELCRVLLSKQEHLVVLLPVSLEVIVVLNDQIDSIEA